MFNHTLKWLETKKFKYEEINGIKYPTKETIIDIHDYLIEAFIKGGETVHRGLMTDANLTLDGIKFYQENKQNLKDDIIFRGALIFNQFLQAGHPFVDGNKRTGFVTLWLFLLLNGFKLNISSFRYRTHLKQINKWASNVDTDNTCEIAIWIKKNVVWKRDI